MARMEKPKTNQNLRVVDLAEVLDPEAAQMADQALEQEQEMVLLGSLMIQMPQGDINNN